MDDLISRDAAKKIVSLMVCAPSVKILVEHSIDDLPAVDAEPVVHARWVEELDRKRHWHCSNCGVVEGIHSMTMNYCPKCGALMVEHPWMASGIGQLFGLDGDT